MSNLYIGDKLNTHTPNTQVSLKALATPTKLSINMAIGIKKLKREVSMDDKTVVRVKQKSKATKTKARK